MSQHNSDAFKSHTRVSAKSGSYAILATVVVFSFASAITLADSFPAALDVSSLDGTNGFAINGIASGDATGISVAAAGDINGDGIGDIIIGAKSATANGIDNAGQSYLVFGSQEGFPAEFDLSSLDGSNGFAINGIAELDEAGSSVSAAGDVNGDGIDDVMIGSILADPNGTLSAGQSYVIFGQKTGFSPSFNLSSLDGTNGFVLNGENTQDNSSRSMSAAGDINADGIDDVIIGARGADPDGNANAGKSYVIFGTQGVVTSPAELSSLDGNNGFIINGIDAADLSGSSASGAGDLNADGIDDLIIGAPTADPNAASKAGESYIIFGRSDGFSSFLNLSSLDGNNGFVLNGIDADDLSGVSVSAAGDMNADGINDVVIGASTAEPGGIYHAGESYVVFGKANGFATSFNLSSLDGTSGFQLNGADFSGESGRIVSAAGDVNGDGIDDIIIGAPTAPALNTPTGAGSSYVVFGRDNGFASAVELSSLDGSNGFVILGINEGDVSGISVSGATDVNGDGIDDVIVGAVGATANGNENAGQTYVVFGRGQDSDSDNIPDIHDNCILVANDDQRDTDNDGYGNICDPDLNNDGVVNFIDVLLWVPFFNTTSNLDADFDGDGIVNFQDFSILQEYFLQPPGP